MLQVHSIPPLFDQNATVLILGSFPSVKSREQGFFYGHPQNRFWKVIAALFEEPVPQTVEQKKALILRHHLALWDVIARCDIKGSSDASIQQIVPNDIQKILSVCPIRRIFVNGKTAEKVYRRYLAEKVGRNAICLPSTSPANAAWSQERLLSAWAIVRRCAEEDGKTKQDCF